MVFNVFFIKTALFCFEKFCFMFVVGDMPEQNVFGVPDSEYLVDNIKVHKDPPRDFFMSAD